MRNNYAIDDEERRTVPMSFRMKPSHNKKLVSFAKKEDRSVTSIIEKALVEYFKKLKI